MYITGYTNLSRKCQVSVLPLEHSCALETQGRSTKPEWKFTIIQGGFLLSFHLPVSCVPNMSYQPCWGRACRCDHPANSWAAPTASWCQWICSRNRTSPDSGPSATPEDRYKELVINQHPTVIPEWNPLFSSIQFNNTLTTPLRSNPIAQACE